MGKRFDCIIFDWSGTLSDDFALCFDATNRLLREHGKRGVSRREFQRVYSTDIKSFYESRGVRLSRKKLFEEYARALEASRIKPKPFAEALKVLKELRMRGVKLFVVSAHPTRVLQQEMRAYGFTRFFDDVIGSIWFKEKAVKKILREQKIRPHAALFVSDVTLDITAGRKAGVKVAAVTHGYHPRAWLECLHPDYLIKNVGQLIKLVDY